MRQLKISSRITSRESMSLEKYLSEINKIQVLTPDEEIKLARRIKEGDQQALDIMTKANLRFVVSVAKQYQNQGLPLSDLINEGNIGIMKAAKRFDESKGFKFISYAVWWIRQSILAALLDHARIVRMPLSKSATYNRVNEAFVAFTQAFEREPTMEELGEILNVTPQEVSDILIGAGRHISMDAPISSSVDDSGSMLDFIVSDGVFGTPDSRVMDESLVTEVEQILGLLPQREADVVRAYFGLNHTKQLSLDEIGTHFDLSRERVRQIKDKAITNLQKTSTARKRLKTYLG